MIKGYREHISNGRDNVSLYVGAEIRTSDNPHIHFKKLILIIKLLDKKIIKII